MFVATLAGPRFWRLRASAGDTLAFRFPHVNWPVWFAVLTLLVLAQVFREGAAHARGTEDDDLNRHVVRDGSVIAGYRKSGLPHVG